jgi:hypothetical protein
MAIAMPPVGKNPLVQEGVKALVKAHQDHPLGPLVLAVWFERDHPTDICLLEVMEQWPQNEDDCILQAAFAGSIELPVPYGGALRLAITNPEGLEKAIASLDPVVRAVRSSLLAGTAEILYVSEDPEARRLLERLNDKAAA